MCHVAEKKSPWNIVLFADWSVNTCNDIIFTLACYLASPAHACVMHLHNEYTRTCHHTNTSTRVSHSSDHVCHVSMFHDVIIHCRHKIALFCVPITWCANAYNENDLARESWYTRFWCRWHDCVYNKCAYDEYLLVIGFSGLPWKFRAESHWDYHI